MRREKLHEFVTELIESTWNGDYDDVAEAVLSDEDAFGALCYRLNEAGDGDAAGIEEAWEQVVEQLDDNDLDWMAEEAEVPAAFLCSKLANRT